MKSGFVLAALLVGCSARHGDAPPPINPVVTGASLISSCEAKDAVSVAFCNSYVAGAYDAFLSVNSYGGEKWPACGISDSRLLVTAVVAHGKKRGDLQTGSAAALVSDAVDVVYHLPCRNR